MRLAAGGFEHRNESTVAEENVRLNVRIIIPSWSRCLANESPRRPFLLRPNYDRNYGRSKVATDNELLPAAVYRPHPSTFPQAPT